MTKETADAICETLDEDGREYTRHDDYSGRGMFGRTTVGIVCEFGDFLAGVAGVPSNLDFRANITGIKTDDMGRSTIYY